VIVPRSLFILYILYFMRRGASQVPELLRHAEMLHRRCLGALEGAHASDCCVAPSKGALPQAMLRRWTYCIVSQWGWPANWP